MSAGLPAGIDGPRIAQEASATSGDPETSLDSAAAYPPLWGDAEPAGAIHRAEAAGTQGGADKPPAASVDGRGVRGVGRPVGKSPVMPTVA